MSNTIKKLSNLEHSESFIQINTIKGFKYIDRAGEIMNKYHKDEHPSLVYAVDIDRLLINKPTKEIEELKLNSQSLWMKFTKTDSTDMLLNIFIKESEGILSILDVEYISRVGWRNHFFYEIKDEKNMGDYLKKFTPLKDVKSMGSVFKIETKEKFGANLSIQPVVKNTNKKERKFGILFDVDIFCVDKIKISEAEKKLKLFNQYLKDEEKFLKIINNTF